ncbi:hypothetical protein [Actinopolymorpha singaporensis]|uniref:Ppx/GppA phosphatase family protein n=1 Tax=Actinopolymorpha singaporensis TaxID=117157 RepID=UPI003BAE53A9
MPTPYLVVDIGGGSTEFVLGGARPEAAVSVDMGCVRLTERYLTDDPPTPEQWSGPGRRSSAGWTRWPGRSRWEPRLAPLVGLAGTVTTGGGDGDGPAGVRPRPDPPRPASARPTARAAAVADDDPRSGRPAVMHRAGDVTAGH